MDEELRTKRQRGGKKRSSRKSGRKTQVPSRSTLRRNKRRLSTHNKKEEKLDAIVSGKKDCRKVAGENGQTAGARRIGTGKPIVKTREEELEEEKHNKSCESH